MFHDADRLVVTATAASPRCSCDVGVGWSWSGSTALGGGLSSSSVFPLQSTALSPVAWQQSSP